MINRNRRAILLGALSLLAVPAFAGLAKAGNPTGHDGHTTSGGGGEGGGKHDDVSTSPPDTPEDDQHDDENDKQS
jgi:hypothetical protein